jgi:hypothetical protein
MHKEILHALYAKIQKAITGSFLNLFGDREHLSLQISNNYAASLVPHRQTIRSLFISARKIEATPTQPTTKSECRSQLTKHLPKPAHPNQN